MKRSVTQLHPNPPAPVAPEIKIEPKIEVITQAPDMEPIATALAEVINKALSAKQEQPNVDVHVHEQPKKPKKIKIDVERDGRGFIKSLICEEIENG